MKKLLAVALVLCLFAPCAYAESIDLSGLSFDELAVLRDRCQMEMMKLEKWEEVVVPIGVYEVGVDIPEGHWTITGYSESRYGWGRFIYCDALDETGKNMAKNTKLYYSEIVKYRGSTDSRIELEEIDIDLKAGNFVIIEKGALVFSPFIGKSDLGFK